MELKIKNKIYNLEQNDQNITKFIELTIFGVTPKYMKWYFAFKNTESGNYHFKTLNGLW